MRAHPLGRHNLCGVYVGELRYELRIALALAVFSCLMG
jgi:hypothetical protein